MAVELGTGYVSLTASAKDLGKQIVRELGGAFDEVGCQADRAGAEAGWKFSDAVDS